MRSVRSVTGFPRMCGAAMGGRLLVAALLVVGLAPASWATSLSDYAVFGGTNVKISDGSSVNGQVGSNGSVYLGSGISIGPASGGDSFFSGGGNVVRGDLNFNGYYKDMFNDEFFNGGVSLGPKDVVDGKVFYGNAIGGTFYGADAQWLDKPVTFSPGTYSTVAPQPLYPGDPLPSSSFPDGSSVTLYGGNQYYCSGDLYMDALNLTLDLTDGPIHVYVDGSVSLGSVHVWLKNGDATISYDDALASPDLRALAQSVYFETAGDLGWNSTGEWFGQIYASEDSVIIGAGSNVTGSIWARDDVNIHEGSEVNVIPEPLTAVGLVLGVLAVGGVVRRRFAASLRRG